MHPKGWAGSKYRGANVFSSLLENLFRLITFRSRNPPAFHYTWPMSSTVRVAVLGAGSLGKEHARVYSELAAAGKAELVGVHDLQPENARRVAGKCRTNTLASVAGGTALR